MSTLKTINVIHPSGSTNNIVNDASGNVTIGGTVTAATNIGGTAASSSLTLQSTSGVGTSDSILFKVGNNGATTAMTINTSGNVGIGTSSPSTKLSVVGTITAGPAVGNDVAYSLGTVGNNAIRDSVNGASIMYFDVSFGGATNGQFVWRSSSSATERMRIDSSGNVGIGTSSPSNALSVARSSGEAVISITNSGTASSWLTLAPGSAGVAYIHNTGNTSTVFTTNSTERFRIGPSGQWGIGGATYGTSGYVFTSGGASAAPTWSQVSLTAGVTGTLPVANGGTGVTTSTGTGSVVLSASPTFTGTLAAATITATGSITAYFSDDRLKTRKGNIQNALAKVETLNGFHYEANETAQSLGYEAKPEVGVSAQEVQAIMPEVVVPAPIDEKYLTVHYERMVPLLIEAIKELSAKVKELESKQCQ